MTAIVGLVHNGDVHIGGDSAGVSGWSLTIRADSKVFRNGTYVCGFTDSFRMGQLLRYSDLPHPAGDLDRFMVTTFVDAIRELLKKGGYAKKDNEREEGGTFLVGVEGRLFEIYGDYQVGESVHGYAAVGSGHELATGALHATNGRRMAPEKRLQLALEAAELHNAGVRGPYILMSTKGDA